MLHSVMPVFVGTIAATLARRGGTGRAIAAAVVSSAIA